MRRIAALFLWLLLVPLAAQEPVFRIRVTMSGRVDSASYTSRLEIGYAPCAIWTGGSGGWVESPAEFLQKAGGLAAIRPGMSLPFYGMTHEGNASGNNGSESSSATVVTTGPGRAYWVERDKDGQSEKATDPTDRPDHRQAARFYRTATGARIADFDLGVVSAGRGGGIGCIDPYGLENAGPQVVAFCAFEITNAELANWKQLRKTKTQTFSGNGGTVTVSAELYVELEDPGEVDVEVEGYDAWIPTGNVDDENRPGNVIQLKAKVYATGQAGAQADRKAKIFFELQDVGGERGVCLNWPVTAASKADLRLLASENPDLEPDPQGLEDFNLKSKGLVKEAKLRISSFDFGAWGLLKVRAEDKDGKPLKVTFSGKAKHALALPKDEDHNHIADAWQEAKGVFGLPSNWDEAEVAGQSTKGDGFGLYQKYRGLVVATPGGRKHVRMEPREKAHFFIDPQNLIDLDQWWKSTGIRGYKVFEGWTQARRVDVHRGHGAGVGKWASRFRKDETEVKDSATAKERETANAQFAGTFGDTGVKHWKPSQVDYSELYPGRVRFALRNLKTEMLISLRIPVNEEERGIAAWLLSLGLSKAELIRMLEAIDEAAIQALTERIVRWAAIHEACHACGVNGHLDAEGAESQSCPNRVPECPMQYPTKVEKRRMLLFGEMAGLGRCCSQAPHHCFKDLNPKG